MAKVQPSNFGVSTCLLVHLMRHTIHSPVAEKPYLRRALRDLRFEEVSHTFGMFFIHDLDTDRWCINGIEADDPDDCIIYFQVAKDKRRALNKFRIKAPEKPNTEASPEYPCGEAPDYPSWQRALLHSDNPSSLVTEWQMERNFADSVSKLAINLFIAFTTDIIHAITLDYVKGMYPDNLNSLEDAMAIWTVHSMVGLLHHTEFVASNFGLEGTVMGPRDEDPNHVDIFFPETSEGLKNSGWHAALQWGYLKTFFAFKKLAPYDFEALRGHLGSILRRLQCVPVAVPPCGRNKGALWKQGKIGFQILVNPAYYRLKRVSVVKGTTRERMVKALKSTAEQIKDFAKRGEEERSKHLNKAQRQMAFPDSGRKKTLAGKGRLKDDQLEEPSKRKEFLMPTLSNTHVEPNNDRTDSDNIPVAQQPSYKAVTKVDYRSGKAKNKRVPPPPRKKGQSMPVKNIVDERERLVRKEKNIRREQARRMLSETDSS